MKLKKVLSVIMAATICFSAVGCSSSSGGGSSTPVDVADLVVPTFEDAGEMSLRVDLPPNQSSREQMEVYKECGFNLIPMTEDFFSAEAVADWDGSEETKPDYIKALEICEDLGIDVWIRPHSNHVQKGATADVPVEGPNYFEKFFSNIDFRDYPAVKGFFFCDEPVYSQLHDLKNRYLPWFNENYGDQEYEFHVNFLGAGSTIWKDSQESFTMVYDDYVGYYINDILSNAEAKNKTFGIDTYPLDFDGTSNVLGENYLRMTLDSKIRAKAKGWMTNAYVQCFTGYGSLRDPKTYSDISFQVYTYLACGVERMYYYGYRSHGTETHIYDGGEPNEKWYFVQHANQVLKKFDGVYFNFEWEGLFANVGTGSRLAEPEHFELIKNMDLDSLRGVKSFKSKYDTIVGQFKDGDGNDGFMLVNYEEPSKTRTNKTTIEFDNADGVLIYRDGDPEVIGLANHTFTIDLDPGEGVFIVPLYKK